MNEKSYIFLSITNVFPIIYMRMSESIHTGRNTYINQILDRWLLNLMPNNMLLYFSILCYMLHVCMYEVIDLKKNDYK